MTLLWIVTGIWAFSFSLIGHFLAGQVDSYIAVFIRTLLAFLIFLPFLRWQKPGRHEYQLIAIGAIQIGLMYLFFYNSFLFLSVPEVLLFTIFTPLFITLIGQLLEGRLSAIWLGPALMAIVGAAIIRWQNINESFIAGFLLVQGANLCFATGQVWYRQLHHVQTPDVKTQAQTFGYFFTGALIVATLALLLFANTERLPFTSVHWLTLVWLGVIASGVGYLMWNAGAATVSVSQLAVMNNMVIPVGIVVNLVFWGAQTDWIKLSVGGLVIILSLFWSNRLTRTTETASL